MMTAAERATAYAESGPPPSDGAHGATGPGGEDVPPPSESDEIRNPRRRVGKRGPEIVGKIWQHRNDPHIPLRVRGDILAELPPGGTATLTGGTGAGKTSLALEIAIRHAVEAGPAIVASLELPLQIIGARTVGIRCDASWSGVLKGEVPHEHMLAQWPERLTVIERRDATLANVDAEIEATKLEHPGEPVLLVVDYVQIMENEEKEIRRRVARSMEELAEGIATRHLCGVLALSQMSRAAARAVGGRERVGADTTDAGAEAAELERWSTCTIAIGARAPGNDGWSPVDLNIGKGRMGGGDMVQPALYCGRSGAWRLNGPARPAEEVKAEQAAAGASKKQDTLRLALVAAADKSGEPLTRAALEALVHGGAGLKHAAIAAALAEGELVEVRRRRQRARAWLIWTPGRAAAAGIPIVRPDDPEAGDPEGRS